MKNLKFFLSLLLIFAMNVCGICAVTFYSEVLNSEAVYVVNINTGGAVIEKNIHQKRSPASLTKIMTFIVAYENVDDLNEDVIVRQEVLDAVDPLSSGVHLKDGEKISVLDLMHCVMICSSGYAANVLADYVSEANIPDFVEKMNQKAKELGCESTHFVNPDGMYDENQYSTAFDMYLMTEYAIKNPIFCDIVSKSEYRCFGDERDPIITTNIMMDKKRGGVYYCPYVKGVKTGFLDKAGRCLVSYAENAGVNYISVVMGGPTQTSDGEPIKGNMAMLDTKNIYDWVYENLQFKKIYPRDLPLTEVNLEYVWNTDKLLLRPGSDVFVIIPKTMKKDNLSLNFNIPDRVEPDIYEGDKIGEADIIYNGEVIGSFDLVSSATHLKKKIGL